MPISAGQGENLMRDIDLWIRSDRMNARCSRIQMKKWPQRMRIINGINCRWKSTLSCLINIIIVVVVWSGLLRRVCWMYARIGWGFLWLFWPIVEHLPDIIFKLIPCGSYCIISSTSLLHLSLRSPLFSTLNTLTERITTSAMFPLFDTLKLNVVVDGACDAALRWTLRHVAKLTFQKLKFQWHFRYVKRGSVLNVWFS